LYSLWLQFTDIIAIFDLLDIHLVHGWLVDPQVSARGLLHAILAYFPQLPCLARPAVVSLSLRESQF
jgi:hypothetical protein